MAAPIEHGKTNNYQVAYEHSVLEIAQKLGISVSEVWRAQSSALEKIKNAILNDPAITHLFAGEVGDKEITRVFKEFPWCKVVRLWDGTIITRNSWFHCQQVNEKKPNAQFEGKAYNIT